MSQQHQTPLREPSARTSLSSSSLSSLGEDDWVELAAPPTITAPYALPYANYTSLGPGQSSNSVSAHSSSDEERQRQRSSATGRHSARGNSAQTIAQRRRHPARAGQPVRTGTVGGIPAPLSLSLQPPAPNFASHAATSVVAAALASAASSASNGGAPFAVTTSRAPSPSFVPTSAVLVIPSPLHSADSSDFEVLSSPELGPSRASALCHQADPIVMLETPVVTAVEIDPARTQSHHHGVASAQETHLVAPTPRRAAVDAVSRQTGDPAGPRVTRRQDSTVLRTKDCTQYLAGQRRLVATSSPPVTNSRAWLAGRVAVADDQHARTEVPPAHLPPGDYRVTALVVSERQHYSTSNSPVLSLGAVVYASIKILGGFSLRAAWDISGAVNVSVTMKIRSEHHQRMGRMLIVVHYQTAPKV
ncbi:hypothetical protein THASP1DRAFT_32963 [Thamnocephalis sphaerospora]|uniref:Uncharacterized protein n=1 Tax=Thamnocephalis sphaerospora TaxID=78915 RepID=A0A4V1IVT7_9FUNG|nr:hypothetical protein THASP1DRAFT_32963 [Thamnocephalis sphaerospora]|eukprot:RKP05199.1 hypothetical protein THASP1DRAFT_32963 [Thamnocephalis sphaerospora]